jgi:hypothetical protein
LYHPGGIKSDYNQNWDDGTGLHGTHGGMDATTIGGIGGAMVGGVLDAGILIGGGIAKTILQDNNRNRLGKIINPFKGITFSAPNLRTQSFNFQFLPTSEDEVKVIMDIIYAFKYFSSPGYSIPGDDEKKEIQEKKEEIKAKIAAKKQESGDPNKENKSLANEMINFGKRLAMDYPCTFNVKYYRRDSSDATKVVENEAINKFGPAVLTGLTIDYSPGEIWRTFRNGFPVIVNMSLTFKEMQIQTKEDIAKGF